MVTRLKQYQRDPNGLGRGPGYYYLRGGKRDESKNHTYTMPNGKTKVIKGPYYSKYSKALDKETYLKVGKKAKLDFQKRLHKGMGILVMVD